MSEKQGQSTSSRAAGSRRGRTPPSPRFLKLSYVGFCLFGLVYLYRYWAGEVAHETRGPLVQAQNQIMQTPGTAWHAVIYVCLVSFVALLVWFVFIRRSEDQ